MKRRLLALPLLLTVALGQGGLLAEPRELTGDVRTHDPSVIKAGTTYYAFSTGDENGVNEGTIQVRSSKDLQDWSFVGTVFPAIPGWITDALGIIPNLWAPDISFANGKYHLYYAGSRFGVNESVIGLATNATLDPKSPRYRWVDEGEVLRSRSGIDDFNAIDPERVTDQGGTPWLVFGSFWEGIKMRRLDPKTGKLSSADPKLYSLASRGGGPVEAPAVVYRGGYYYLLVSFDRCCRRENSTYRVVIGRSRAITGPYLDKGGTPMSEGGGNPLLSGGERYRGPGGQDILEEGGEAWLVHHHYDAEAGGDHKLDVRLIRWTPAGWPYVLPR